MDDDFKLAPPPLTHEIRQPQGGARPGAGRPKGRLNKRSEINWRRAEIEWPIIYAGILLRAKRLADPHHTPSREEYQCAFWIGERMFAQPRSAPIEIDISQINGTALMSAMVNGHLTPGDVANLSKNAPALAITVDSAPSESARDVLVKRLSNVVEMRQRQPENGGYNPASRDESQATSPMSDTLETRVQQAFDAGDAATLEALADELEK